jgi:hypothetical protein
VSDLAAITVEQDCDECAASLRAAFDTEKRQWCSLCARWWTFDEAVPHVNAVRAMAADLVDLRKFLDRRERRTVLTGGAGYGVSAIVRAITYAGIAGSGCRGTKGVGSSHGPTDVADAVYDARKILDGEEPPEALFRFADLVGSTAGPTLLFVRDTSVGEAIYTLNIDEKHSMPNVTFPQWVGLHLAPAEIQARWHAKIVSGDSSPARMGADRLGNRLLFRAAIEWWRGRP